MVRPHSHTYPPLQLCKLKAGFPSPALDYVEDRLTATMIGDMQWSMQRGHLSPYYTTRMSDIPKLR